jgi:heme a synthase
MAAPSGIWLRRGLVLAVVWCFILTTFGAFVRLADAGLGCPDWPTCYGELTWPKAHEVDQANAAFPERPVEHHKTWPEQVHRHIAAGLGVLVLILCLLANKIHRRPMLPVLAGTAFIAGAVALYIAKQPMLSGIAMLIGECILLYAALQAKSVARWMTITLALISFQALLGMWTVTLLVKPAIVTAHLLGGFATLALLLVNLLMQRGGQSGYVRAPALARKWIAISGLVLLIQITLGGWVSTNYAALACPDFPQCKRRLCDLARGGRELRRWHTRRTGPHRRAPCPSRLCDCGGIVLAIVRNLSSHETRATGPRQRVAHHARRANRTGH